MRYLFYGQDRWKTKEKKIPWKVIKYQTNCKCWFLCMFILTINASRIIDYKHHPHSTLHNIISLSLNVIFVFGVWLNAIYTIHTFRWRETSNEKSNVEKEKNMKIRIRCLNGIPYRTCHRLLVVRNQQWEQSEREETGKQKSRHARDNLTLWSE